MLDRLQQMVMIAPVDAKNNKTQDVARNTGATGRSAAKLASCGSLNSSTMIVMMIAITPSLNASQTAFPHTNSFLIGTNPMVTPFATLNSIDSVRDSRRPRKT